jgi:chemotaxis regulatin CheY-phosphate phosphatase CheZ
LYFGTFVLWRRKTVVCPWGLSAHKANDSLNGQDEVDDLLASLGL